VQYIHLQNQQVQVQLLELFYVDATDGSSEKIYQTFKNYTEEKGIPLKNIVGLACNEVVVGKHNSFYTSLKHDVPHVILLKCICHSAALVASKACRKLPNILEDLLKNIYSYVSESSKLSTIRRDANLFSTKTLQDFEA